jgi:Sugar phosphate permease
MSGAATAPAPAAGSVQERIAGRRLRMLLVAMAGTFVAIMDSFIVNVAVPSVRADLNATFAEVELAVSGYVLVYGLLLVTGGRLGDLFGARRLFLAGPSSAWSSPPRSVATRRRRPPTPAPSPSRGETAGRPAPLDAHRPPEHGLRPRQRVADQFERPGGEPDVLGR